MLLVCRKHDAGQCLKGGATTNPFHATTAVSGCVFKLKQQHYVTAHPIVRKTNVRRAKGLDELKLPGKDLRRAKIGFSAAY